MIILRRKFYAALNSNKPNEIDQSQLQQPDTLTSKDLQIEQMKMQRQIMATQRMRQKMQAEERQAQAKQLAQLQKAQQKDNQEEKNNQVKVQRMQQNNENLNPADRNWNLVKTKAKTTQPVSMKQGN